MTVYDAMTGEIYPVKAEHHKGDTILKQSMFDHDSLLLWLESADEKAESEKTDNTEKTVIHELPISDQVEIVLVNRM